MKASFKEIREKGATSVIIDIRENSGGDSRQADELQSYISDLTLPALERVSVHATPEVKAIYRTLLPPGFRWIPIGRAVPMLRGVAAAADGAYFEFTPGPDRPRKRRFKNRLSFTGDVFVLIGTRTYSSAAIFAAPLKHWGRATLVGAPTGEPMIFFGDRYEFDLARTGLVASVSHKSFRLFGAQDETGGVVPDIAADDAMKAAKAEIRAREVRKSADARPWRFDFKLEGGRTLSAIFLVRRNARSIVGAPARQTSAPRSLDVKVGDDGIVAGELAMPDFSGGFVGKLDSNGRLCARLAADGEFCAQESNGESLRDFAALLDQFDAAMERFIFDPRLLREREWREFREAFGAGASQSLDDADFLAAFRAARRQNSLFSHFDLRRGDGDIARLIRDADAAAQRDAVATFREFSGDVGIIEIRSFFGDGISAQINAAFDRAVERSDALVIDLRGNAGGTIAAWPVAARIVNRPALVGYFLASPWWQSNSEPPTPQLLEATASPLEPTARAFGADLFSDGLAVMRFNPSPPSFNGPVALLVDERSASTTEVIAGALQQLSRVKVVGRRTAGEVLNADLVPLSDGFSLLIPMADFRLADGRRLEGRGVIPDFTVDKENDVACAVADLKGDLVEIAARCGQTR